MNNLEYYKQAELWGGSPDAYKVQVRDEIQRLLPKDVNCILDVGCGDGFITNSLPAKFRVVGVDITRASLKYVTKDRMIGSIDNLPFANKSFDLVMANDVIEHIPEGIYARALQELQRVAKKYILITVPLMENLEFFMTKCSQCGQIYHINHHQRAFGIIELNELFKDVWTPFVFVFSGESINPFQVIYRTVRNRLGILSEWNLSVCPKCQKKSSSREISSTIDSDRVEYIALELARSVPLHYASLHPDRSECLVLFKKKDKSFKANVNIRSNEMIKIIYENNKTLSVIPVNIMSYDQQMVVEIAKSNANPIGLEWESQGQIYRYSNPTRFSTNKFHVPAWFHPVNLQTLSPSQALWVGEKGTEILLTAIETLFKELPYLKEEIKLRSGRRGTIRVALECLGIKSIRK